MVECHYKEDKGKRWHENLMQASRAEKTEDLEAVRFPEMTSTELSSDATFALQVANYEAAKKAVEKSMPKSQQRKGKHVYND